MVPKEAASRCYACTTAYVTMIHLCNVYSVLWKRRAHSQHCSWPCGRLEETADGIWSISFYDVLLARLDERDFRLYA
jgi:hypothetical protein